MSSESVQNSTHPEFPNGTEVVNTLGRSRYFGQRGTVYGSGPSKTKTSNLAIIYVRWPNGDTYGYFPSRLAVAPKKESEYRVSSAKKGGKSVQVHEVPAEKRPRPTIFQRINAEKKSTS